MPEGPSRRGRPPVSGAHRPSQSRPAGDRVNGRRGQRAEASQLTGVGGQPGEALGPFQLGSPSNYSTWGRDESWTIHPRGSKVDGVDHLGSRWWEESPLAWEEEEKEAY